jgi:hypothetical protein
MSLALHWSALTAVTHALFRLGKPLQVGLPDVLLSSKQALQSTPEG